MPRLLVVERDAARRDALQFVLTQAGYEVSIIERHEAVTSQLMNVELLIVGDSDLDLLGDLPQQNGRLSVSVLALINPGNCEGILSCLAVGVAGVFLGRGRAMKSSQKFIR